ncbi:MAG: type II toxin-antitoxin system HicA family toxin [Geobacter sp.]|nr:type II toxin-antitoxin system HicA family toxin [Geobacter sp.]
MSKLPVISAEDMAKILLLLGFERVRQRGSHVFFNHPDGRNTVIPFHKSEDLGRGLLRSILRDAEISIDEYLALRKKV